MRIGMVVDNEYVNDPRVTTEAKRLVRAGYEVVVLCYNYGSYQKESEVDGVYILRVKVDKNFKSKQFPMMNWNKKYEKFWKKEIENFIAAYEPDLIHAHDLYMSKAAKEAIGDKKIPLVLDLHENFPAAIMEYEWATKFPNKIFVKPAKWQTKEREYLGYADKIIVLSDFFKNQLMNKYGLGEDKFNIYPNVPDASLLNSPSTAVNLKKNPMEVVFTYFGNIGTRRGVNTCFEALKEVLPHLPNARLVVIGPVDKRAKKDFDAYMNDEAIKSHVTHIPWIEMDQLKSHMDASDVCLSPILKNDQHESGVANKVFQYMMFANPLIVSNCAPQAEVVEESGAGLVYESGNASELAACMLEYGKNDVLRVIVGHNGRKAVAEYYNPEVMGLELIQAYYDLMPELHDAGEEVAE